MKQLKDASNSRSNTVDIPTDLCTYCVCFKSTIPHFQLAPTRSHTEWKHISRKIVIRTKEDLIDYCTSFLFHNLVRGDAILIQEAYAAAKSADDGRLLVFEQLCGAMKLAKESRDASVKLGRQFIRTVSPLGTDDFLTDWKERMDSKQIKGHYAILYGIYSATTGVSPHHAVMTYLFASLNGLVTKCSPCSAIRTKYGCSSNA